MVNDGTSVYNEQEELEAEARQTSSPEADHSGNLQPELQSVEPRSRYEICSGKSSDLSQETDSVIGQLQEPESDKISQGVPGTDSQEELMSP